MLKLLTLTLNPALDIVYEVQDFALGGLNRQISRAVSAGGKGINTARAFQSLGGEATVIALTGGSSGARVRAILDAERIAAAFVDVDEDTRACIKIVDKTNRQQTELNETGPVVADAAYNRMVELYRELVPQFDIVLLSGSVPPGVPETVYADLIRIAQDDYDVPAMLDAADAPLKAGIAARPEMVKPNLAEARSLIGVESATWQESASALRDIYGVSIALVTAGPAGAAVDCLEGSWSAVPPSVNVRCLAGSGDSLTAGYLWARGTGRTVAESLAYGVAAGAVNAEGLLPGKLDGQAVADMASRISLAPTDRG